MFFFFAEWKAINCAGVGSTSPASFLFLLLLLELMEGLPVLSFPSPGLEGASRRLLGSDPHLALSFISVASANSS